DLVGIRLRKQASRPRGVARIATCARRPGQARKSKVAEMAGSASRPGLFMEEAVRRLNQSNFAVKREYLPKASICWAVLWMVALGATTGAQTASTGALSGTVSDSSGAVVSDATVNVTNEATGDVRHQTTQKDGTFLASLLLPGTYRVEVTVKGFKTLV